MSKLRRIKGSRYQEEDMNLKRLRRLACLLLATGLALALSALPSKAQENKIRISYPGPSICCLSLFAAHQWKIFDKNGLAVEIIQARSQAANAALMSGDINYVAGVGPNSVVATLRGMPTRAVWFASNKSIYSLMSKPDIATLKDLRSKKIGVSGLGGTAEVSLKIALEAVHENPKNFTIIGVGGSQLLQALAAGTVDAVQLNPPYIYFAKKKGFKELLDVGSRVEMPLGGLTTMVATIRNKPDEVKRVIRSIQQAKDLMLQQKARSVELIANFLKVDRESAEDTFNLYKNTVSENGVPTTAGMNQIIQAIHMLGQLRDKKVAFTDVADDHIAREVAKELGYKVN
jgi:ABC-type nitrate/sulfonate/bicarbonate transport system substrate-binding protein